MLSIRTYMYILCSLSKWGLDSHGNRDVGVKLSRGKKKKVNDWLQSST